ncbi:MAG: bifunctional phosphoribosyl-AMP cyclohydrolase/phosphoribosyl-ATP diphosphatase HisIE [Xanthomonadales bacterium]|nr:bifunctional phosphoribosyl-AMP cyclohydrolase/phosphoribosyl-ATP diphosphatase HisIE [Xanthomonadales bacterium]
MTRTALDAGLPDRLDFAKGDGLLPMVVQHAHDGRVLMLGWIDRAALEATLATGQAHFHSRSRQRLWRKGETSGHVLEVRALSADCDGDTVLCQAVPVGPTCHRGTATCFDGDDPAQPWLNALEDLIARRLAEGGEGSYVARLFAAGLPRIAQKVGEEGVETALAAVTGDNPALLGEAADLLFHLLVLLRARGLALKEVVAELERRHTG